MNASDDLGDLQLARDRALAARMVRGDEQAIREFCDAYLPRLYRLAQQRLASTADADDVVQIVLSTAARRIATFRGDSTLYAWLAAICRREAGRYRAASARRRTLFGSSEEVRPWEHLAAPDHEAPEPAWNQRRRAERVRACLGRLPDRYAEALELKYIDGYSSKEMATELGLTDEAVQSLLARARRAFREECDDELREAIETTNGS